MKNKRPQDFEYFCLVCSECQRITEISQRAADSLIRKVHGWSLSKHGWLCNWHIGEFSKDRAKDLAAALELHTELRPRREFTFYGDEETGRDWRLDFAFVEARLAIEIEGGVYTGGRHTRPSGFIEDMEKYNTLTLAGWKLLRYTPDMVTNDPLKVIAEIRCALGEIA